MLSAEIRSMKTKTNKEHSGLNDFKKDSVTSGGHAVVTLAKRVNSS